MPQKAALALADRAISSFQTGMDTLANHNPKCPDHPEDFTYPSARRGLLYAL
jgi:hypothetical protein